jgi:hypothetical protein
MVNAAAAESVEYGMLRLCARRQLDDTQRAALRSASERAPDWQRLIELADYHRLIGVLARQFEAAEIAPPAPFSRQLKTLAETGARRNLRLTAELIALVAAFNERAIPVLPYKGPVLALAAWGDLSLRPFADLDLLVQPDHTGAAVDILIQRGYRCRYSFNAQQDRRFAAVDGDYPFEKDGTLVELHCRITSERFAVPLRTADLFERASTVGLGGRVIRTLSHEDLIIALCLHGCKHRWASLGWVADLGEVIRGDAPDWDLLLTRADRLNAMRIVAIGLLLARDVNGAPLPARVEQRIAADREAHRLAETAAGWLTDAQAPGTSGMIRYNYSALANSSARLRFAKRWLFDATAEDFSALRLPAVLTPLYSALRPLRLAWRYGFGNHDRTLS